MVLKERSFTILSGQRAQRNAFKDFPDIPVMLETLLSIELCLHERCIDLEELSELVLNDPGATIQIMRQASQSSSFVDCLPCRIEDCISALGTQACLDAVSRRTAFRECERRTINPVWKHSRAIAESCEALALESWGEINAEEAYMVGLLHELGHLPVILGWKTVGEFLCYQDLAGLILARAFSLPHCVVEYFIEVCDGNELSGWSALMRRAHKERLLSVAGCLPLDEAPPVILGTEDLHSS